MANLYPFSSRTARLLAEPPKPGGTHLWLARAAGGLNRALSAEKSFAYLRRCCDEFVTHRPVPDREIRAAVDLAYPGQAQEHANCSRRPLRWPEPDNGVIRKVLDETTPCFDGESSTGMQPADILPHLFDHGDLVCTGAASDRASVRPLADALADADRLQFIVPNSMLGPHAPNRSGRRSIRCQNNVGERRHIVAEFDDDGLTKAMQARLVTALADVAPLVLAVDSGGKSVHGWFHAGHWGARDQARFFAAACLLGADPTRWDICGWVRMPGGLRTVDGRKPARQRILYFNPRIRGGCTRRGAGSDA
jgi:hypothetical protein